MRIKAANLESEDFYEDYSDYPYSISDNNDVLKASNAEPLIVPDVKLENDDCDEVIDVFSHSSQSHHNGSGLSGVHRANSFQMQNGYHSSDEHLNGILEPEIELNEEEPYDLQHSFEEDSDYQEMHRMRERFQQLLNSGHLSIFPATVEPEVSCVVEEKEAVEDENCSQVDGSVDSFSNYKVTRILKDGCWQFVCTECNESFPNRNAAYKHRSMVHEMDNPFQCFLCGKENNSKQRLLNHIDCDHQSESEQFCDICGRYFGDNELMLKHRREEHEKHYVCHCSICDKGFKSKNALEYHNNHLHLKAFRCDVCDAWFTRQTTLKQH
ncbi:zinc finger protein 540-like protein, partial [Leptotrombidium deliense]